ncbi:MAG: mechanosensitive ion channel family protein [Candidatus Omnitrophica bacterium]|nr:mechanosensitive ion channel family protein [Candidatus Omnitrophota bacterium]
MLEKILQFTVFSNRILDYCISLIIFLTVLAIAKLFNKIILAKLKKWADTTSSTLDNFLISTVQRYVYPVLYYGIFYLSIRNLILHVFIAKLINISAVAIISIFSIRAITAFLGYTFHQYLLQKKKTQEFERSFMGMLSVIKVIVWGVGIIFLLDNLGFKISAVIAGLGIGGVAVALAAQTILGDLFSYLAILFDRPFEIGDFIVVGDFLGTIEHIGVKTTRIRSLGGEQIVFSNSDLTNSRMRNYKRMDKRRIVFKIGVTYNTPLAQIKEIPCIIKDIIGKIKNTLFDRAHFAAFGDFSLIYEVAYYVLSQDYNQYMDIQQEINIAVKEKFTRLGIEFAYPTQTVYVAK